MIHLYEDVSADANVFLVVSFRGFGLKVLIALGDDLLDVCLDLVGRLVWLFTPVGEVVVVAISSGCQKIDGDCV